MASTVDLHIHTNASDGTDTPEQLLWNIQKAGITIFSITDHDTIKGALKMKRIIPRGVRFVQGVEFSCRTEGGAKCHILGLNYDENNPNFQDALRTGDNLRRDKFYMRIKLLREKFGIDFTDDDISNLQQFPSIGKPHIANMIVMKGYAANKQEAIDRYLNKCKTGVDRISASQAVKAILSAGGIPVWAHPLGGEGERETPEQEFRSTLQELMSFGLKGLECWYSKYTAMMCRRLADIAGRSGLLVSGGSDYHGANKSIPLGRLNSEGVNVGIESLSILRKL